MEKESDLTKAVAIDCNPAV